MRTDARISFGISFPSASYSGRSRLKNRNGSFRAYMLRNMSSMARMSTEPSATL